jgi:hypothetical protein
MNDKISIIVVATLFVVGIFSYKSINTPDRYATGFSLKSASPGAYGSRSSRSLNIKF